MYSPNYYRPLRSTPPRKRARRDRDVAAGKSRWGPYAWEVLFQLIPATRYSRAEIIARGEHALQPLCERADVLRGRALLSGAVGGFIGTWAMSHSQRWWTLAADGQPSRSSGGKHDARDWQERSEGQNANELVAQSIGERVTGRPLTPDERRVGAQLMHYAFGTAMGALYGASRARARDMSLSSGIAFGLALWAIADELAMPILGLSRPTTERPLEMHLQAAAAHIVYGGVAELTRAGVSRDW